MQLRVWILLILPRVCVPQPMVGGARGHREARPRIGTHPRQHVKVWDVCISRLYIDSAQLYVTQMSYFTLGIM